MPGGRPITAVRYTDRRFEKVKKMNNRFLACCLLVLAVVPASGQRWQIGTDQRHIVWRPGADLPHEDCVEMTGRGDFPRFAVGCRRAWSIPRRAFPGLSLAAYRSERYACQPRVPYGDRHTVIAERGRFRPTVGNGGTGAVRWSDGGAQYVANRGGRNWDWCRTMLPNLP